MKSKFLQAMLILALAAVAGAADQQTSAPASGNATKPETSFDVSPTLAGGLSASAYSRDENGFIYIDGYYMPFGDHMTGGGGSIMVEAIDPKDNNGFGLRSGYYFTSGSNEGYDMSMYGLMLDFYVLHRMANRFSLYAGVGLFAFFMDMEVPYVRNWGRTQEKQDAEGDAAFFSCFGGVRFRITDFLSVFCEYRYEDGDIDLTLSKSHTSMTAKDVGGGRFVFGGGLAF